MTTQGRDFGGPRSTLQRQGFLYGLGAGQGLAGVVEEETWAPTITGGGLGWGFSQPFSNEQGRLWPYAKCSQATQSSRRSRSVVPGHPGGVREGPG